MKNKNIISDTIISYAAALGITIETGLLKDIIDLIVVTLITVVIVPLIRWVINSFIRFLKRKGLINEEVAEEFLREGEMYIKLLEKKLDEAILKGDKTKVKILKEELKEKKEGGKGGTN